MLSIPYLRITPTGFPPTVHTFPWNAVAKPVLPILIPPGRVIVIFVYPPFQDSAGDIHNVEITFDLWDLNPAGTGFEATIDITVTDNIPAPNSGGPWTLEVPVRADFDIHDLASLGMDDAYIYTPNPAPPPAGIWTWQGVEVTYAPVPPPARVVDPVYGMEVLQGDSTMPVAFPGLTGGGPWGGIAPFSIAGANPDIFHLVLYNPGRWEYSGLPVPPGPGGYVNGQGIAAADVVIWDETSVFIPGAGGLATSGTITLRIWLY